MDYKEFNNKEESIGNNLRPRIKERGLIEGSIVLAMLKIHCTQCEMVTTVP
jgi:hypothetical protein